MKQNYFKLSIDFINLFSQKRKRILSLKLTPFLDQYGITTNTKTHFYDITSAEFKRTFTSSSSFLSEWHIARSIAVGGPFRTSKSHIVGLQIFSRHHTEVNRMQWISAFAEEPSDSYCKGCNSFKPSLCRNKWIDFCILQRSLRSRVCRRSSGSHRRWRRRQWRTPSPRRCRRRTWRVSRTTRADRSTR